MYGKEEAISYCLLLFGLCVGIVLGLKVYNPVWP